MRIDWAVVCRYAEAQPDGTLSITGAGVDTFWLPDDSLPAPFPLVIAFQLVGAPVELERPHALSIRVDPPAAPPGEPAIGRLEAAPGAIGVSPSGEAPLRFPAVIQIRAEAFGVYTVHVDLDD